jgi:putative ABC transport system substrate-binding protein
MKRREFITLFGGTAVWPLVARAQQPVIGFLHGASEGAYAPFLAAFRTGLADMGYIEPRTVTIEYRWANGDYEQLPRLAADLVVHSVSVIAAGTPVAALAAQRATRSIPVVFMIGSDPVRDGLVNSLSRPEGNITGATFFSNLLSAKRIELLRELAPQVKRVAVLVNPKNANADREKDEAHKAAGALGLGLVVIEASNASEIETSIGTLASKGVNAVLVAGDAFFTDRREQIAQLTLRYALPTSGPGREWAKAGCLIGYGGSLEDMYRVAGNYVGRILKGERPGDLPVQQAVKFDFALNMRTAKSLGLNVPLTLQVAADEVIE